MAAVLTPTAVQVAQRRAVNEAAVDAARREFMLFWRNLDVSDPVRARNAMLQFNDYLVRKYGDITATLAADFYDQARAQAGVRGAFRALAVPPDPDSMNTATRRLAGHLFGDSPEDLLPGMLSVIDLMVSRPGRDTLINAIETEKVRFARIPGGPDPCRFCLMLGSRGFVYRDAMSAGDRHLGDGFHHECKCEVVPSWDDRNPLVEGYDPDDLMQRWQAADDEWEERTGGSALREWSAAAKRANQRNSLARNARARADYAERRQAAGARYTAKPSRWATESVAQRLARGN